jgi:hypothetical protein
MNFQTTVGVKCMWWTSGNLADGFLDNLNLDEAVDIAMAWVHGCWQEHQLLGYAPVPPDFWTWSV